MNQLKGLGRRLTVLSLLAGLLVVGCRSGMDKDALVPGSQQEVRAPSTATVNGALFSSDALVKPPEQVSCTLSNGQAATCLRLTLKYKPDQLNIGPFCPGSLDEAGGIWNWDGQNAGLYRVNGEFLKMLSSLGYRFFDDTGKVYTSTDLSVRPSADHACLNVAPDRTVQMTVLLPLHPKMAGKSTALGTVAKVGLALDGVPIFADAPSVLQTGHMPALDVCGGHIDPGGWYHWHATSTDINGLYNSHKVAAHCELPQSARAQFAYAFDGFALYGSADANGTIPNDLDECSGHTGSTAAHPEGEYHYHATSTFPNLPACLKGLQAKDNFVTTAKLGIGSKPDLQGQPNGPGGGAGGPPDLSQAAKQLGVNAALLEKTMRDAGGPQADLALVAKALSVNEAELRRALPGPGHQAR
jgi:hypothetical protein